LSIMSPAFHPHFPLPHSTPVSLLPLALLFIFKINNIFSPAKIKKGEV
jgi:hypothetical protein